MATEILNMWSFWLLAYRSRDMGHGSHRFDLQNTFMYTIFTYKRPL